MYILLPTLYACYVSIVLHTMESTVSSKTTLSIASIITCVVEIIVSRGEDPDAIFVAVVIDTSEGTTSRNPSDGVDGDENTHVTILKVRKKVHKNNLTGTLNILFQIIQRQTRKNTAKLM